MNYFAIFLRRTKMMTSGSKELYNASTTFLDANLEAGRANKVAIVTGERSLTYAQIAALSNQLGHGLKRLDVRMEERVMLLLPDSPEYIASFWGAIRIGAVPIPTNTFLRTHEYENLLNDSRAVVLIVNEALYAKIEPIRDHLKFLRHVIMVGKPCKNTIDFNELIRNEPVDLTPADTTADDVCFWLYSSGTTGFPKGTVHLQHDMAYCAENYARNVLGMNEDDCIFSVPRLFFAYGLGNSNYFPLYVGAKVVLIEQAFSPQGIYEIVDKFQPTLFFSVPTNYAALLALPNAEQCSMQSVRACISAGEGLPKTLFTRWKEKWGFEILDGIGSTEVLHIFISNRPGRTRPGSTGEVVPGYKARIVDDDNQPVGHNEIGNLLIKGDSTCAYYWNKHADTKRIIEGEWIRTGDKYIMDEDQYYWFQGRSDDMLKVSGIWVSPLEVESAVIFHPSVLECAVVGHTDKDKLIKPIAYVVLKPGFLPSPELSKEILDSCKNSLPAFKVPVWIEFTDQLPKNATGKIQRYRLRERTSKE
jgi:benzoate-CoA ligase family protein